MPPIHNKYDEIKRTLRELKKFELRIRSNNFNSNQNLSRVYKINPDNMDLVWNKFFDPKEDSVKNVKYTLEQLFLMTKEEFKDIINEYFYHIYYWYYKESGLADNNFVDMDLLTKLGLPIDANHEDIIRCFKELVKSYHPDNGGDVGKFIDIMESYNIFKSER
jgi:hypothetical protein